jgi:hypothetical protein
VADDDDLAVGLKLLLTGALIPSLQVITIMQIASKIKTLGPEIQGRNQCLVGTLVVAAPYIYLTPMQSGITSCI